MVGDKKKYGLYENLMQQTSVGNERKNLQYLTNELFQAAQADLREAVETGQESNIHRDKFLETLKNSDAVSQEKAGQENFNKAVTTKQQVTTSLHKLGAVVVATPFTLGAVAEGVSVNSRNFNENYEKLKVRLHRDRVLGVGKTLSEQASTLMHKTLSMAGRAVGVVIGGLTAIGGAVLCSTIVLAPAGIFVAAGGAMGAASAVVGSSLGRTRQDLKNNLTMMLSDVEVSSATSPKSQSTPKALKENKLWKKSGNNNSR